MSVIGLAFPFEQGELRSAQPGPPFLKARQMPYRLRLVMGVSSSKTHCRLGGGRAEN